MKRSRALGVLGVAAGLAGAAVVWPLVASSAAGDYKLPDLVSVAPPTDNAYLIEGTFSGTSEELTENRLLVRFDGFIDNVGDGPVHFQGDPSARSVTQWAQRATGGPPQPLPAGDAIASPTGYPLNNDAEDQQECVGLSASPPAKPAKGPCVIYSTTDKSINTTSAASDGHNHWHLVGAARYSLWNEAGSAQVSPGQKVGFCMYDYDRIPGMPSGERFYGYSGGTDNFCQQYNPKATSLIEGINPGFRDVYESRLAWQWIDVSNIQPGRYRLGDEVDPFNRIWEKNEDNPVDISQGTFVVPGWAATGGSATTGAGAPVAITLGAAKFGDMCKFRPSDPRPAEGDRNGCTATRGIHYTPADADRRFVITAPPARGTLSVAAGQPFTAQTVTYTPAPGASGTDTFAYAVYDAASAYPLTRTSAAVSVTVGAPAQAAPAIAVSGNPASMDVNTQVALQASVVNGSGAIAWSVNGIAGGDATVGTVSPAGVYAAPASVPAGGVVTVRAALASDPAVFRDVAIRITTPPTPQGQPLPFIPPAAKTTSATALAKLRLRPSVTRIGSRVVVRTVPPANGRLAASVFRGKKRLKACVFTKAVRGRATVCYLRNPRTLHGVRVVTSLKVRGTTRTLKATVSKARI